MRRFLVVVIALVLVGAGTVVKIRAQGTAGAPTHQQAAQKLLQTRAAKYMTAPALAAIQAIANNDRSLGHGQPIGASPKVNGSPPMGGHLPNAPGLGNVRVNNPGEDSHQAEQTTQSETTQAVAGNNVVVGFNDSQSTLLFLTPGSNLSGYAYSNNGGQSFVDGGNVPNAGGGTINFGDPWLASDTAGNFYYSTLIDNPFEGLRVGVAKSTNGGKTFSAPTELPTAPPDANNVGSDSDKDALASTHSGLYASWDTFDYEFDPNSGNFSVMSSLPVAHSTDGGQTWNTVNVDRVKVFDTDPSFGCSFHQYIGAQPFEGSNGTMYDAALRFDDTDPNCLGIPPTESEVIFASHDQGATWGPGVVISTVTPATQFGAFVLGTGQFMREVEFPVVASVGNTLYVAWNDGGDGSGHSHIRLASSTSGGPWSVKYVTSGSNDEAQPALSSDGSTLHLAYYEISPSPSGNSVVDVFAADSSDGTNFTTHRITNQSFPGVANDPQFDPIIAPAYMGDYISVVSSGGHQYYAWGDNRDTVTDFMYPQGRNDPDVFFAKQ